MRSDKEKNKIKVMKEVAENPMASQREIAEKVWVSVSTVNEHIKDLPNSNKSEHIETILKKDLQIVNLAQQILQDRLEAKPDDISTRDIIASADVSAKRYSLFKWDATDKEWGMKDVTSILSEIQWLKQNN